ncbi:ABC transporter permease [Natronosporangium hydrolyticum]|uniref:ABC transporter permease n=1 Tax=Natronosporangium hydrolyticum TaxID=2811111 RepID=A0A895YDS3_9ACTN|nr:ABC transporter permease [Natronosporangium hydrolyticum]QSB12696.1 ABC transporter permease [Natronosporangium hydrolyticum]
MLRATLKSLLSRKLRLMLSGLAVVLGVMFVAGSLVLTDTIGRSFNSMLATAYDEVDVVVTGASSTMPQTGMVETEPIPTEVLDQVQSVAGVGEAVGLITADGARVVDDRTGQVIGDFGAARLGGNWPDATDSEFMELRDGRGPTAADEIAINQQLADSGDIAVGDRVEVLTLAAGQEFTVVGIWGYSGDRGSLFGETHVAFTTEVAQELMLGIPDVYTDIDVIADGVSPEELRDAISAEIGPEYEVKTGDEAADEQAEQLQEALSFFNYILLGFAGVALFVGVFLILNTFSIIVAQRLRELALLRAIGASRRQMIGSVMLEATVIGAIASLLGLGLGIGVGAGLGWLITSAFGGMPLAGIGIPASAVIGSLTTGMVITLFAALFPALRASRVPPVAAMQEAGTPDRPLTKLSITGAVITIGGAAALAASLTGNAPLGVLLLGVLLAFVGVALLTPLVARPVTSLLGRIFAWSTPGDLGRRNTGRNPRRTAITAAALMVGVALVTAISTIFSSLNSSIEQLVADDLQADLVVAGEWLGATPPTFEADVLEQTRQLPEVESVAGFWYDFVEVEGGSGFLLATDDLGAWAAMSNVETVDGSIRALAGGEVAIDDRLAEEQALQVGDTIPITLPRGDGERQFEVVGVYERNPILQGHIIGAADAEAFRSANPVEAFIQLNPDADADAVRGQVEQLLAGSPEVVVQDQSGYLEQQTQIFDQLLVFIQILLVLAMLIAVLGVINTLVLSVIERTRELGLLRAVGLTRGATARMVTVESVVISLFGALLGIGVGAALGSAVVYALRDEGLNQLTLPTGLMVTYVILGAIVGVIAAIIPAIRAARLNVLNAISYE